MRALVLYASALVVASVSPDGASLLQVETPTPEEVALDLQTVTPEVEEAEALELKLKTIAPEDDYNYSFTDNLGMFCYEAHHARIEYAFVERKVGPRGALYVREKMSNLPCKNQSYTVLVRAEDECFPGVTVYTRLGYNWTLYPSLDRRAVQKWMARNNTYVPKWDVGHLDACLCHPGSDLYDNTHPNHCKKMNKKYKVSLVRDGKCHEKKLREGLKMAYEDMAKRDEQISLTSCKRRGFGKKQELD